MSFIDKEYFTFEEIEERWQMPRRDLAYLSENGLLRLSVRLFGVVLEYGCYETLGNGELGIMPLERTCFTGFQDLGEHEAFRLFRDGAVEVGHFSASRNEYCQIVRPSGRIPIRLIDVVIRREERDRVEELHGLVQGEGRTGRPVFHYINDYTEIRLGDRIFSLGPVQSRIVRTLHQAALTGDPWCIGKAALHQAGSGCTRLSDSFKSQPNWRQLIESDGKGRYRLRLPASR
jgi:hypothetical protein